MKNNMLVFCLIVIIAMLLGIIVSIKLISDSALIKFVAQQQQILALHKRIDQQISTASSLFDQRLKDLENRLSMIENKPGSMSAGLQMIRPTEEFGPALEDFKKVYDIPVGTAPIRGKVDAKVTIIGFLDLQCPFSARFQPVIDQVLAAYPGRVNYVIKHFPLPFHQQAKPAAKAVLAAGEQGKYWEMVDSILKDSRDLSKEKLEEFAKTIKLDMKKFEADLKNKESDWEKLIQADYELGLKVDVRGTPTYYINGRKTKSRNLESLKKEIDTIFSQK